MFPSLPDPTDDPTKRGTVPPPPAETHTPGPAPAPPPRPKHTGIRTKPKVPRKPGPTYGQGPKLPPAPPTPQQRKKALDEAIGDKLRAKRRAEKEAGTFRNKKQQEEDRKTGPALTPPTKGTSTEPAPKPPPSRERREY